MKAVINGKFFSYPDFSETVQEDLSANLAHRQIGITAMINEFGAASPDCSIEHRAFIQANYVNAPCFLS